MSWPNGEKPWRCLLHGLVGDVEILVSPGIPNELQRGMGYDRLSFTDEEQRRIPEPVEIEATVVEPDVDIRAVEEDPDDDVFLECAVAGHAAYVVSGDPHLADLEEFRGTPILEPAAFLGLVQEGRSR